MSTYKSCYAIIGGLMFISLLSGIVLLSTTSSADNTEVIDQVRLTVPIACTMTGTGTTHTATLSPGAYSGASGSEYENGIGKTTLTAICNDDNGFSIYAIGFTGNEYSGETHTKLIGQNTNGTITTKAYASGDTTSNWSMKLTKITDSTESYNPTNLTITTGYDTYHAVPDTYTKVAQYKANTGSSTTDTTLGVKLETTYAAYIASNQPADTYIGQVKYTMVRPYNEQPLQPQAANSGCINYFANASNAEGTMGCQSATDGNTVKLFASNFSREGYGFAGWSDAFDYATNPNAHFYGPNEGITVPTGTTANGLAFYAVWIKSAGTMQSDTVSVCNGLTAAAYNDENDSDESTWSITANLNSISALTDARDGDTYAIAKLTDNRCWMIENLRIADTHQEGANTVPTTLTTANTNNPLNDGATVTLKHNYSDATTYTNLSPTSSDATSWCTDNTADCDDQSRIRTDNTTNRASYTTISKSMSSHNINLYSYGVYYNWYSATAGRGTSSITGQHVITSGDLCPHGWHLPTGTGTGEFGILSNSLGGYKNNIDEAQTMSSSTIPTHGIILQRLRQFPTNLLYSGFVTGTSLSNRGSHGEYWSSTTQGASSAYDLYFYGVGVYPGTSSNNKYQGKTVRCIASPSN